MIARYDLREDSHGWTVYDVFTGVPVVWRGVPQVGLELTKPLGVKGHRREAATRARRERLDPARRSVA